MLSNKLEYLISYNHVQTNDQRQRKEQFKNNSMKHLKYSIDYNQTTTNQSNFPMK